MKTVFRSVRPWWLVNARCFPEKGLVSGLRDRKARLNGARLQKRLQTALILSVNFI
jgi:hypothetical protein